MITMTYTVENDDRAKELDWLHTQKIYPSVIEYFDYRQGKLLTKIGVIVNPEAALIIKMRHNLDTQTEYRQR